jgi:hypothetical protein
MMQTQAEQERDLEDVRIYLGCTSLRVDRCRHESVAHASIWIFDHGGKGGAERQIASIVRLAATERVGRLDDCHWRVSAMLHGMPVSLAYYRTLLDAVGGMMSATKGIG